MGKNSTAQRESQANASKKQTAFTYVDQKTFHGKWDNSTTMCGRVAHCSSKSSIAIVQTEKPGVTACSM